MDMNQSINHSIYMDMNQSINHSIYTRRHNSSVEKTSQRWATRSVKSEQMSLQSTGKLFSGGRCSDFRWKPIPCSCSVFLEPLVKIVVNTAQSCSHIKPTKQCHIQPSVAVSLSDTTHSIAISAAWCRRWPLTVRKQTVLVDVVIQLLCHCLLGSFWHKWEVGDWLKICHVGSVESRDLTSWEEATLWWVANLPNRYSALCWRPVTHAQTWASYSALYRFGKLSWWVRNSPAVNPGSKLNDKVTIAIMYSVKTVNSLTNSHIRKTSLGSSEHDLTGQNMMMRRTSSSITRRKLDRDNVTMSVITGPGVRAPVSPNIVQWDDLQTC